MCVASGDWLVVQAPSLRVLSVEGDRPTALVAAVVAVNGGGGVVVVAALGLGDYLSLNDVVDDMRIVVLSKLGCGSGCCDRACYRGGCC